MRRSVLSTVLGVALAASSGAVWVPAAANAEEAEPEVVELVDEGTEDTKVFQNPDGTRTAELYGGPVRLKRDGQWVDVDYDLAQNADGTFSPKAAPADVTIGGGGSKTAASVDFEGDRSVALSWPTTLPQPKIDGGVATYKLSASTDLIVAVTGEGVTTRIRLNQKPADDDPSWRLRVSAENVDVAQSSSSSLSFKDDATKLGATSSMVAWDDQADAFGEPLNVVPVTAELADLPSSGNVENHSLDLSAAASFLDNPATQYPVVVDPDINAVAFLRDIWVRKSTEAYWASGAGRYRLLVGRVLNPKPGDDDNKANNNTTRSYLAWNNSQLANKKIVRATMSLYQYGANTCAARVVQAYPLASGFNGDSTSWDTGLPSERGTEGTGISTNRGSNCSNGAGYINFDITAMTRKWANGAYPNHGVSVRTPVANQDDITYGRRFCSNQPISSEVCNSTAKIPVLKVTYNGPPLAPQSPTTPTTSVNGVATTTSSKPTWTAKATDPEGSRLKYEIQVHSSTAGTAASLVTSCTTTNPVASGTAASCTPATALTNGSTYYTRAKAIDQPTDTTDSTWPQLGGPWSGFTQVRVDSNYTPPAPVNELYDEVGARKGATRLDFPAGDMVNASVDVGTGNLLVLTDDLKLPGIGGDTQLGLDYNSLLVGSSSSAKTGTAGVGWQMRLGQDTRLVEKDDFDVAYFAPGGLQAAYANEEGTSYDTPDGWDNKLTKTDTGWTLRDNKSRSEMKFNTAGRLASITDKNNQDIDFSYSDTGAKNLTAISSTRGTDDGRRARFEFTGNVVTKMYQSVNGETTRQVTYSYDNTASATPLLTRITDTLGRQTDFGYDSSKRLTSITNTEDVVTTFAYNTNNKVTKVVRDAASNGIQATTRFMYTDAGNTLVADPKTDQSMTFDQLGQDRVVTYNISPRDPDESDKAGPLRVKKVRDELGRERGKTYTPDHDVETSTSPMGNTSNFSYGTSSKQSLSGSQSPTGAQSSTGYGAAGDPNEFSPGSMTDAEGREKTMSYDGSGNQTGTGAGTGADVASATVEYYKNSDDPDYDGDNPDATGDGVPKKATSPGGEVTTFDRDRGTHQITRVDPESDAIGATELVWDRYGRLTKVTDGRNKVTDYAYDDADRRTSITYSDSTPDVSYTYDVAGNMTSRVDGTGTTTFGYDKLNRLVSRDAPGAGGTVTYAYDKAGNMTQATDEAGTTTYAYDRANQLQTQMTSGGKRVEYSYDRDGNRTNIYFDTNADNTAFAAHTRNEYDSSNRLIRTWTSKNNSDAAADRVFDTSYCYAVYEAGEECPGAKSDRDTSLVQYSVDHNRTVGTADDRRTEYTYDSRGRLVGATNYQGLTDYKYTYDADSNLKTIIEGADDNGPEDKTYNHNSVNQLTNEGFAYDKSGNRTSSAGAGTITYDGANRMTQFTSTRTGGNNATYTWAGTDMTELAGRSVANGSTFKYTYGRGDGNGLPLVETFTKSDSSNGAQRWGIDYDNTGSPIALLSPGGTEHYFALDRQGSSVALINANGAKTGDYQYTPYGEVKNVDGNTAEAIEINFYRHTLGMTDFGASGFIKHGVRFADPETGTWTTQDPLNAALDLTNGNRYLYAGGDPINNTDLTGYFSADDAWRGFGYVSTGVDVLKAGEAIYNGQWGTVGAMAAGAIVGKGVTSVCTVGLGVETFGTALAGCAVGGAAAGAATEYWAQSIADNW